MKLEVAAVGSHFVMRTDAGELRTPGGKVIRVCTLELAEALADELSGVDEPDPHEPGLYGFASTELDFVHQDRERIENVLISTLAQQLHWCFNAGPPEMATHSPCDALWDRLFGEPVQWRRDLVDFGVDDPDDYAEQYGEKLRPRVTGLSSAIFATMLPCGASGLPVAAGATLAVPDTTWRELSLDLQNWIWLGNGMEKQASPRIKKELKILAQKMEQYVRGGGAWREQ